VKNVLQKESRLWQQVKKYTPNITWTRIESWSNSGFPDLVGYTEKQGFFTVELKVTRSNNVRLSAHQKGFHIIHPKRTFILVQPHDQRLPKLYPGSDVLKLAACGLKLDACGLTLEAWSDLERLLLDA
jgi:hypothetical protein|tara:strand:- start:34 stop:417 length:384 start_codon:yes stop_codon:yes gene_type:complete